MAKQINPQDRRSSTRIDARINLQFRSGAEFRQCYSENISRGGIYLETEILPDPNALIELILHLPGEGDKTISLRGRVVRQISVSVDKKMTHKLALQFVDVPPEVQAQLDLLNEQLLK